ncbi:MAG: hypothetical protein AAFV54_09385 [Pseudomonadota bacterium]
MQLKALRKFVLGLALTTGLVVTACGESGSRSEFIYSSWTPPNAPNNTDGTVPLFAEIEAETNGTEDEITFRNFMSAQLLTAVTTLTGVRDGVAHGGFVSPSYFPAELKHHVTLAELQALTANGFAAAAANTETLLKHCPECLEEYDAQNIVPLGVYATTSFHLMCNFDLQSIDQLQGKRVAEGSTMFSRWARVLGMSRQALPPSEFQQALRRGTVDCVFAPKDWLVAFSIADSVDTIVNDTSHGVFPAAVMMAVNKDKWTSTTDISARACLRHSKDRCRSVIDVHLSLLTAIITACSHQKTGWLRFRSLTRSTRSSTTPRTECFQPQ